MIIASFFFWYASLPLQKSYEELLRALLYQVLEARPELTTIIFPKISEYLLRKSQLLQHEFEIRMPELHEAFRFLTKFTPNTYALFLMIDGVDEYNGEHFEFSSPFA